MRGDIFVVNRQHSIVDSDEVFEGTTFGDVEKSDQSDQPRIAFQVSIFNLVRESDMQASNFDIDFCLSISLCVTFDEQMEQDIDRIMTPDASDRMF